MQSLRIYTVLGCLLMASTLLAQGQPRLEIEISEIKVNQTEAERNGEVDTVYSPGDTIQYTLMAKNTGDGIMTSPEIVDPIPEGVSYVANSARGEDSQIFFSINSGAQYTEWPILVEVSSEDGAQAGMTARPDQVTHVKWIIDAQIPPGGQKELSFMVIVE